MSTRILIIDDEPLIRWSLRERLTHEGYECTEAENGASAVDLVRKSEFNLALQDLRLPDIDGIQLLQRMHEIRPGLPVIIMTAYSTVDSAVKAMKIGARDYIAKPFNMDELTRAVARALEAAKLRNQLSALNTQQKARFGLNSIIGGSQPMKRALNLVARIAQSDAATVLLLGESGTGKDMVARAIHYESSRVNMPFMNITCTALPETLLDSELFGYEKGAFTDARAQKKGLFELADGGTVFLDEVGDMSPALQGKLLRVLEDRAFKRIGGAIDIQIDVRVIAATNRDLGQAIENSAFREDLYYRLSAVPILLPPLRNRQEDIPALAEWFLNQSTHDMHRETTRLTDAALSTLRAYPWPGNVRELRNAIERAVLTCEGGIIDAEDLSLGRAALNAPFITSKPHSVVLPENGCSLDDVERDLVRQALERTDWNQTRAARLVGITRDQIRYKIEKYNLLPP